MISHESDPLRFLKPRKKQFHLTPTKSSKKNEQIKQSLATLNSNMQYSFLRNQITKKEENINISTKQNLNLKASVFQKNHIAPHLQKPKLFLQSQKGSRLCSQTIYNPLKYFSIQVEKYLQRNKYQSTFQEQQNTLYINKQFDQNTKFKKQFSNKNSQSIQNVSNFINFNEKSKPKQNRKQYIFSQQYIIPLNKNDQLNSEPSSNTMRLQDYFENQSKESLNNIKERQIYQNENIDFSLNQSAQKDFTQENNKYQIGKTHLPKKLKDNIFHQQKNDQCPQNNQKIQYFSQQSQGLPSQNLYLKSCETCGRKFNPNSYQKHVKICQKVFFKKRKQFSSQKQRSKSKNKAK